MYASQPVTLHINAHLADMFRALHGQAYTLDGIAGTLRYATIGIAGVSSRVTHTLAHEPTEEGRHTDAYRATRQQLGDDWHTDLTQSERLFDIAHELGFDLTTLEEPC